MVEVMDFEEFAARNGASRQDVGEVALHKRGRNQTNKQWARILREQSARDQAWEERRAELREEHRRLVLSGEVRPRSRIERLRIAASGHPDNESTKAAIRILARIERGGAMNNGRDCEHGRMIGKCEICELEHELVLLQSAATLAADRIDSVLKFGLSVDAIDGLKRSLEDLREHSGAAEHYG